MYLRREKRHGQTLERLGGFRHDRPENRFQVAFPGLCPENRSADFAPFPSRRQLFSSAIKRRKQAPICANIQPRFFYQLGRELCHLHRGSLLLRRFDAIGSWRRPTAHRARIGLVEPHYPFHDRTITQCSPICFGRRKINLSTVFVGQNVGIKEVRDRIWLVSLIDCDLGFFDHETGRLGSAETPSLQECYPCLRYKPLPM